MWPSSVRIRSIEMSGKVAGVAGPSTSPSLHSMSGATASVNNDIQVRQLKSRIDDWSTCPTTDPATKKSIVNRLQAQLDVVTHSIESREKEKASQESGVGTSLDLSI